LHTGEHNLNCGVRFYDAQERYDALARETHAAFERADFSEIIRILDRQFGEPHYSLKNLFRDEQFKVLNQILAATREEIYNGYRQLTDRYAPLARFLNDIHAPPLHALAPAMEFVVNAELRKQFENGNPDAERVKTLISETRAANIQLDSDALAFAVKKHFERMSEEFFKAPENFELLQKFSNSAALLPLLPFSVNLWKAQNIYDQLQAKVLPEMKDRSDENCKMWIEKFLTLGEQLGFHVQRD
jgi:Domain of unknown function (DUF3536)